MMQAKTQESLLDQLYASPPFGRKMSPAQSEQFPTPDYSPNGELLGYWESDEVFKNRILEANMNRHPETEADSAITVDESGGARMIGFVMICCALSAFWFCAGVLYGVWLQ